VAVKKRQRSVTPIRALNNENVSPRSGDKEKKNEMRETKARQATKIIRGQLDKNLPSMLSEDA
jgi:hypothetical protein